MWRSTQREILRKRPKKHLRILGDCWEKFICSSLPVRLMGEFPASKKHLRPATWLTGKFPSRRMSRYYSPVWVWGDRVKFSLSVRGEGGGSGCWQIPHTSYSRQQIPSDSLYWPFDSNHFPSKAISFYQISQPAKIWLQNRYFEEEIHWVPLHVVMLIQALQTKLVLKLLFKGYLAIVRTKSHMKSISRKHTDYKTPNISQGAKITHLFNTKTPPPWVLAYPVGRKWISRSISNEMN